MNMFNRLPNFVEIKNIKYKINVDFRYMLQFEKILKDNSISDEQKVLKALQCFYPYFYTRTEELLKDASLYKEACEKLIWFYRCGREETKSNKKSGATHKQNKIYDFELDDEYIWEAFYRHYKIDLTKDFVHWWKFRAILKSLPEDTQFSKIQGYRSYKGDDKNLLELKNIYKLPLEKEEQERLDKLYDMLK